MSMSDLSRHRQAEIDRQRLRRNAALLSLVVGGAMFVMKTSAYFITGSAAILSDAMESVVHVLATSIAFYSIVLVGRPADREHPYGYGKVEYFSAGAEGLLIVLAAVAICYEAVGDLIKGPHLRALDLGAWVIGAAGVINFLLGWHLVRTGRKTNSLVLIADGKHVLTDSYTSIGVLAGVILVAITGLELRDPLVAIAVALNIVHTGYQLLSQSIRGLMNTSDPATLERIVEVVNRSRTRDMIDLHRLRAWSAGERRFIDFHLTLPSYLQLHRVHGIEDTLRRAISGAFEEQAEVMIHIDPCNVSCCVFCPKHDCPVRQTPQQITHEFTLASVQEKPAYRPLEGGKR